MDPVIKDYDDTSHIWTKEEIIECGLCDSEEPEFERDEVNDITSVGAQDEYDADPDVLSDDANDFEDDNNSPIIHEIKEETSELAQEATVELVIEPVLEQAIEPVLEQAIEPVLEQAIEPALEQVIEPVLEQAIEPALEQVIEPVLEQAIEPVLEQVIEPVLEQALEPETDVGLPFNIEKKEENEEKEDEKKEKGEPDTNTVISRLALDEHIIEESAPKNIIVDENNLPFIDEEKEEIPENTGSTAECVTETAPVVEEPLNIVVPIIVDNEVIERSAPAADDRASSSRRDIATFETPPAKKFKWKDWFQSLWFWT